MNDVRGPALAWERELPEADISTSQSAMSHLYGTLTVSISSELDSGVGALSLDRADSAESARCYFSEFGEVACVEHDQSQCQSSVISSIRYTCKFH